MPGKLSLYACFLLFVSLPVLGQGTVHLTVGAERLTATGVTPNARAILFGRSVTYRGGVPLLRGFALVEADADGDGVVTWTPETVSQFSVWVAVDAENGAYSVGVPDGYPLRLIELSSKTWKDKDDAVDMMRSRLHFLMVRPGKGAWTQDVFQGGLADGDGQNDANLRVRTTTMRPLLGKESPPPHAVKKDVLVIIDPNDLDVAVVSAQ